jgi:hypothetical protein
VDLDFTRLPWWLEPVRHWLLRERGLAHDAERAAAEERATRAYIEERK